MQILWRLGLPPLQSPAPSTLTTARVQEENMGLWKELRQMPMCQRCSSAAFPLVPHLHLKPCTFLPLCIQGYLFAFSPLLESKKQKAGTERTGSEVWILSREEEQKKACAVHFICSPPPPLCFPGSLVVGGGGLCKLTWGRWCQLSWAQLSELVSWSLWLLDTQ